MIDDQHIESLREWLASWGDGPNWSDASGQSVPITKLTLVNLLDELERYRKALREIRSEALNRSVGQQVDHRLRATIATIADTTLLGEE